MLIFWVNFVFLIKRNIRVIMPKMMKVLDRIPWTIFPGTVYYNI